VAHSERRTVYPYKHTLVRRPAQVHFSRRDLVILLLDINTRVAGVSVYDEWPGSGETVCVLVENDVTLILDELALLVDTINLTPTGVASLKLDAGASETSSQGIAGFPGMVMRDFAVNVMGNVGLRDTMGAGSSDPSHDRSEVTKEVTIVSRQGTTRESELAGTIVREEGVGVLQESDQHEPVINPEVRNEVGTEDLEESKLVDRVAQTNGPEQGTDVRDDDLPPLVRREHYCTGFEMVGARGVTFLTVRVEDQVGRPTAQQVARRSEASANGGVSQSIPKLVHNLLADGSTLEILVGRIKGGEADVRTSLGDEDLILGQMSGGSVVFAMCDTP